MINLQNKISILFCKRFTSGRISW